MAFFALLAILMTVASYLLLITLAVASVGLSYAAYRGSDSNIQLLLLCLFGIAIAGALLWSLIPKRDKFVAPGPRLERASHPQLFAELECIAALLDQPMPKDVYLIGEMNAYVADRGGLMGFGSHRIISLGLPLLSVLTVAEFRAILAHEFAHFYGGDTKLGPWVYKARRAMVQTFENVGSLRKFARIQVLYVVYMILFYILKWYFMLFLRITSFISRRQEYRADELACIVGGSQPPISGLQTIRAAAPAWASYWHTEVTPLLAEGTMPVIADGFARFIAAPNIAPQIQAFLGKELLKARPEPYDTHPPLIKRIQAAQHHACGSAQSESKPATSLLGDLEDAESGLIKVLQPKAASYPLKRVPWDELVSSTLPTWSQYVQSYASILQDYTVETLPAAVQMLPQFAHYIRQPKGRLLDMEQRQGEAADLLAMALCLALLKVGWELHIQPGQRYLSKEGEKLAPFAAIGNLASKKLSSEDWVAKCRKLNIATLPLAQLQKESPPISSSIA